jgi:tRNA(Ile)-lysidine synthase
LPSEVDVHAASITSPNDASPIGAAEFAALMARFEPFETRPRLAVAVSGGADSMALVLLARDWVAARGGGLTALTVDHRLRQAAAAEATQVGRWLAERGIAHGILVREDGDRAGGVQAAARQARYRLLEGWCRQAGVLHLLLGHHREDQAETLLLRLARGSGLDGLAGMASLAEHAVCRLLRPLLGIPRARLTTTLQAAGQGWIDDPSNRDAAYARVRIRDAAAALGDVGLGAERLAATAARLGRARAALEHGVSALLARAAMVHPAGFVRLDPAPLLAAAEETGLRALASVLAMVGGEAYPPRLERLERLYGELAAGLPGGGRTLAGCRILLRRGGILVCREPAAMARPVVAPPGTTVAWDNRFRLFLPPDAPSGLVLGALGEGAEMGPLALPAAVRAGLPALGDEKSVVCVPALGYVRGGVAASWLRSTTLLFRPTRPLSGAGFTVV